jgi:hypothetical protein
VLQQKHLELGLSSDGTFYSRPIFGDDEPPIGKGNAASGGGLGADTPLGESRFGRRLMIAAHWGEILKPSRLQGKGIVPLPASIILPLPDNMVNTVTFDPVAATSHFLYPMFAK